MRIWIDQARERLLLDGELYLSRPPSTHLVYFQLYLRMAHNLQ